MLLGTGGAWDLQRDGWAYDVKYDGYPTLAVVAVAAGASQWADRSVSASNTRAVRGEAR